MRPRTRRKAISERDKALKLNDLTFERNTSVSKELLLRTEQPSMRRIGARLVRHLPLGVFRERTSFSPTIFETEEKSGRLYAFDIKRTLNSVLFLLAARRLSFLPAIFRRGPVGNIAKRRERA